MGHSKVANLFCEAPDKIFRRGRCHSSRPFVSHPRVKFRRGRCHSNVAKCLCAQVSRSVGKGLIYVLVSYFCVRK